MGAVVVHAGSLLMIRRAQPPAAGLWTIPGGRVEHGEYLADAVQREVAEETGLSVEVGRLLGVFEVLGEEHFVILDYLATASDPGTPAADDDAVEARWVLLDDVASLPCTPRLVEMLRAWGVLE